MIVYLNLSGFISTSLGNKRNCRAPMALANDGELIVLSPGPKEFVEDKGIERLIRKYDHLTMPEILELVKKNSEFRDNHSAATQVIYGSHKNRFKVTHCPVKLTREKIKGANFSYGNLDEIMKKYDPAKPKDGFNVANGEKIFYISNPALGLWVWKTTFSAYFSVCTPERCLTLK